jgi:hypothetical protein
MRREGRDLPKVVVQGRKRCNPSLILIMLNKEREKAVVDLRED